MRKTLAVFILALTGCIPVPAHYYTNEPISGTLTYLGKPVAGVDVVYDEGTGDAYKDAICNNVISSATTNESGEFELAGKEKFFYFVSLLGPTESRSLHKLCFNDPQKGRSHWSTDGVRYPGEKETIKIKCSLAFPETECQMR